MLALFLSSVASAFCGLYVGTGAPLHNRASQVVVAHNDDGSVVLTLAPDYDGALADFGLVIPVPAGTGAEDVSVVAQTAIDHLDEYSAPRLVRYACSDLYPYYWAGAWHEGGDPRFHGCTGGDVNLSCTVENSLSSLSTSSGDVEGVSVESHFTEGSYDISVLSAEDSSGLLTWLANEGYAIDASAETALQGYIEAGVQFLVARVQLETAGSTWLTPLQIRYTATAVTVPIRLGAVNADGPQEVELYVLDGAGRAYIQNYPEVALPTDCMAEDVTTGADLGPFWDETLDAAFAAESSAWATVFAWNSQYACDPCPEQGQTFFVEDAATLGFTGGYPVVTRMHARWGPDDDLDDLVLGFGYQDVQIQSKLIIADPLLEGDFPYCGEDGPRSTDTLCADLPGNEGNADHLPIALFGAAWLGIRRWRR